jgi:DNA gyrase subunit B
VRHLNRDRRTVHESVFHFVAEDDRSRIEAAAQWTFERDCTVLSFANDARTNRGGTHESGFLTALTEVIRTFASNIGCGERGKRGLWGKHCQAGLTAVLSVRVPEPRWRGRMRDRLFNPESYGLVRGHVIQHLTRFLLRNPDDTNLILSRAVAARNERPRRKASRRGRPDCRPPEGKA